MNPALDANDILLQTVNSNMEDRTNLCYDYKHHLLFCVASSTWESILITLQGRYQKAIYLLNS